MLFKAIAHWWASSRLEEEEARTRSLIRDLDRAKEAAHNRIQIKKSDYSCRIKDHQAKRDRELKVYIDFMNEQLTITAGYLPKLNQFQSLMFTCVDSWMRVDLLQQEINIVDQRRSTISTTIGLIDAYIFELKSLSQSQSRKAWCEFTSARELTVTNDFVEKTMADVNRSFKSSRDEYEYEIQRLESHRKALRKAARELDTERYDLLDSKKVVDKEHKANKQALSETYYVCLKHWNQIARKFEAYYAFKRCELQYVNEWLGNLKEGGTLSEIKEVIGIENPRVRSAKMEFYDLRQEYDYYKCRVQEAHDRQEYTDTFANDKAQRDRLRPRLNDAFHEMRVLDDALKFLFNRRDELNGYVDRIKPLHPDTARKALCEMLSADCEFDAGLAFGYNVRKQKRIGYARAN